MKTKNSDLGMLSLKVTSLISYENSLKISHYKKRASLYAVYLYLFSFIEKVILHAGMLQAQSSLSS